MTCLTPSGAIIISVGGGEGEMVGEEDGCDVSRIVGAVDSITDGDMDGCADVVLDGISVMAC